MENPTLSSLNYWDFVRWYDIKSQIDGHKTVAELKILCYVVKLSKVDITDALFEAIQSDDVPLIDTKVQIILSALEEAYKISPSVSQWNIGEVFEKAYNLAL